MLDEDMIPAVFGLRSQVIRDPVSGKPMMLPIGRHRLAEALTVSLARQG
ncbi:MAG: hypothetical protein UMU75_10480 [Halomonas sp.]|nr:hypothetical protein [Halomonas sp.]